MVCRSYLLSLSLTGLALPFILPRYRLAVQRRERAIPPPLQPDSKYVWNDYLVQPFRDQVNPVWVVYAMHGFVAQSNLSIFGKSIYVTLIARRSRLFAGTRFMKRGTARCSHSTQRGKKDTRKGQTKKKDGLAKRGLEWSRSRYAKVPLYQIRLLLG